MRACSGTSLTGIPKASKPLHGLKHLLLVGCNLATVPSFLPGAAAEDPLSAITTQMPELEVRWLVHDETWPWHVWMPTFCPSLPRPSL